MGTSVRLRRKNIDRERIESVGREIGVVSIKRKKEDTTRGNRLELQKEIVELIIDNTFEIHGTDKEYRR